MIAVWREPSQLQVGDIGVKALLALHLSDKLTLLQIFELDRPGQWSVGAIAYDIWSEWGASAECQCKIFVGDIRRKIRDIKQRFVEIRMELGFMHWR